VTALIVIGGASSVSASHEAGPEAVCDGEPVQFWPNSGLWGVKKAKSSSTTYIPVRRSIVVHVEDGPTYGPFWSEKGNGNAHSRQDLVECTFTILQYQIPNPFDGGTIVDATFEITIWAVKA
jgi:hypothetical protein